MILLKLLKNFMNLRLQKKQIDEAVDGFIQIDINLVYYNNLYHIAIDCYMYCDPNNDRDYLWTFHNTLIPSDNGFIMMK